MINCFISFENATCEGRIFLMNFMQNFSNFFIIVLTQCYDSGSDSGFREFNFFDGHIIPFRMKCLIRISIL